MTTTTDGSGLLELVIKTLDALNGELYEALQNVTAERDKATATIESYVTGQERMIKAYDDLYARYTALIQERNALGGLLERLENLDKRNKELEYVLRRKQEELDNLHEAQELWQLRESKEVWRLDKELARLAAELDEVSAENGRLFKRNAVVQAEAIKAVEDEPEFPGDMPECLYRAVLRMDKEEMTFLFRNIVVKTKEGIINRMKGGNV